MRLLEYYRFRDWEISFQKSQLRGSNQFYRNIPWGGIGLFLVATLMFGVDLTLGVTQGALTGSDIEKEQKDAAAKKRAAEEVLAKRSIGFDAIQAHRDGKGPLAIRQEKGLI